MKLLPLGQVSKEAWNEACEKSDEAWLFHTHEWVDLESRFFAEANYSFAIVGGRGEVLGVHPLYVRTMGEKLLDSGVHRHTGLALRNDLGSAEMKTARALVMNHIFDLARQHDVDRIQLNSHNLAPLNLSCRREDIPFWVSDYGFYLGLHFSTQGVVPVPGMATCCADQIVNLEGQDETTLFRNLEGSCQRAIRKAQKHGLKIVFAHDKADVDEYYQLAQVSAARTGEMLPSKDYYSSIFERLHPLRKCQILFSVHDSQKIGALFLLVEKGAVSFMAGASRPDCLPMRPNDLMHWAAIKWAKDHGYSNYRLGPIFPEMDREWPLSRVSRFKKKFGGRNVPTIQGSFFLKPEKYLETGLKEISVLTQKHPKSPVDGEMGRGPVGLKWESRDHQGAEGLRTILHNYGLIDLPFGSLSWITPSGQSHPPVIVASLESRAADLGCRVHVEPGRKLYYARRRQFRLFPSRTIAYHALLPHTTFSGDGVTPVWVNDAGRAVIAWYQGQNGKALLIGLDVEEEIIRHRQGDPVRVEEAGSKGGFGFDHERPNYLFLDQIVPQYRTQPWADNLGFVLAEHLSQLTGHPLLEPLPTGSKGLLLLTGDDDQAWLEKYQDQLKVVGDVPITYFLHHKTRHTSETVAKLPSTVEFGVHPDALDDPDAYDRLCAEQVKQLRDLTNQPMRAVRNHGFLNRGYLGHLQAWEQNDLCLDVNYPGVDGTALNGSFLPMRVRRPDRSWSDHYSLLTLFGDGMIYALQLSQRQAVRKIRQLAAQIEGSYPGVIVFNFHPQNIDDTRRLHEEVVRLARRPGWIAMGVESYLRWLEILHDLHIERVSKNGVRVTSSKPVGGLVLRFPENGRWRRKAVEPWAGTVEVQFS